MEFGCEGQHGGKLGAGGVAGAVEVVRVAAVAGDIGEGPADGAPALFGQLGHRDGGAERVVHANGDHAGGGERGGGEDEAVFRQSAPVAAMDEDLHRGVVNGAGGQDDVQSFGGRVAVPDIAAVRKVGAGERAGAVPVRHVVGPGGHGAAHEILRFQGRARDVRMAGGDGVRNHFAGNPATASISISRPGRARAATPMSVLAGRVCPKYFSRIGLMRVRSATSSR